MKQLNSPKQKKPASTTRWDKIELIPLYAPANFESIARQRQALLQFDKANKE